MLHVEHSNNVATGYKQCYEATQTQYISDVSSEWFLDHLTDVVAAGGSDGLVDHLLTHNTVECLLDTTQQTSLRETKHCVQYNITL